MANISTLATLLHLIREDERKASSPPPTCFSPGLSRALFLLAQKGPQHPEVATYFKWSATPFGPPAPAIEWKGWKIARLPVPASTPSDPAAPTGPRPQVVLLPPQEAAQAWKMARILQARARKG